MMRVEVTAPVRIMAASLLAAASAAFMAGCGEDSPVTAESGLYYTSVYRRASVVPENDSFYLHHIDGDDFVFFSRSETEALDRGRVVAGTGHGGYLRRVLSAGRDGAFYHAITEPASLSDIFNRCLLDVTLPAGIAGPGGGGIDLGGLVIHAPDSPGTGVGIVIEEGWIAFEPETHLVIGVMEHGVGRLGFTTAGPLSFTSDLTIDLQGPFDLETNLETAGFRSETVVRPGGVPVVIGVEVTFDIHMKALGEACDSCRYHFEAFGETGAAAEYSEGAWHTLDTSDISFSALPLVCSGYSDGEVEVSLEPKVSIRIYGRPVASMGTDLRQAASASGGLLPDWQWAIEAAACRTFEYEGSAVGGLAPGLSDTGDCGWTTVASGPYRSGGFVFVSDWGSCGDAEGSFLLPSGVAAAADGSVYVSDRNGNRVSRFAPDSTLISSWGSFGTGEGEFNSPTGLAVSPSGDLFVVDKGNRRIQRFSPDGVHLLSWGSYGDGDGRFREPEDVSVSADGLVYVTDSFSGRVQVFTPDGVFNRSWPASPAPGEGLAGPSGIVCGADGYVYVTGCYDNGAAKFSPEGSLLLTWGAAGAGEGEFACPTGISYGPGEIVLITDYGNDRVQVFTTGGVPAGSFGYSGAGRGGFDGPFSVASAPDGYVYVVDSKNCRVQRFLPLP